MRSDGRPHSTVTFTKIDFEEREGLGWRNVENGYLGDRHGLNASRVSVTARFATTAVLSNKNYLSTSEVLSLATRVGR